MELRRVLDEYEESKGRRYRKYAEDFHDWLESHNDYDVTIFEAAEGHLKRYLKHLYDDGEGYSPTTLHLCLAAISGFYEEVSELAEMGFNLPPVDNPTKGVSVTDIDGIRKLQSKKSMAIRGKHVVLSEDEIKALVNHVPSPALRNELLIKLMLQTACRRGELSKIRLQDINQNKRTIKIYGEKTDEYRVGRYQDNLKPLLSQWIDVDRKAYAVAEGSDFLFPSRQSDRISTDRIGYIVKKAAKNAGIQEELDTNAAGQPIHKVTSHSLRSTAATRLLNEGMPTRLIQEYLGHSSVTQTEEYLNPTPEEVLDAVDKHQSAFDFEESDAYRFSEG